MKAIEKLNSGVARLLELKAGNDFAGAAMLEQSPRFENMKNRHIEGTAPKAITGFNLFQTPKSVAAEMATLLREKVKPGARLLEPSAGLGRLVEPLEDLKPDWVLVEDQLECCKALADMLKRNVKNEDFLSTDPEELGQFDGVIMNPPFKQGTDIKHIKHALKMLKPGGRLVSLCYNGVKQNAKLKELCDQWHVLPENSFKESGTGASVAMIVIDKPE